MKTNWQPDWIRLGKCMLAAAILFVLYAVPTYFWAEQQRQARLALIEKIEKQDAELVSLRSQLYDLKRGKVTISP